MSYGEVTNISRRRESFSAKARRGGGFVPAPQRRKLRPARLPKRPRRNDRVPCATSQTPKISSTKSGFRARRRPFHLQVSSGLAGAHKPQTLEQTNGPIESDHLQPQRPVRISGLLLHAPQQKCSQPAIAKFGEQSDIQATQFVLAGFDEQAPGACA